MSVKQHIFNLVLFHLLHSVKSGDGLAPAGSCFFNLTGKVSSREEIWKSPHSKLLFSSSVLRCRSDTTVWGVLARRLDCHVACHGVTSEFIWWLTVTSIFGSTDHTLPLSSSPALPVYLTINARTRLDWRPCCSPRTWWEWCTPCIVSYCTVSCRSLLPRVRNPMARGSSRWLCKASVSSTVLPCLTYLPSRYS